MRRNEFADGTAAPAFPDGYMQFPTYIEVSSDDDTDAGEVAIVELVTTVLRDLWARDVPAVAECGFDDRLPHHGGYGSSDVPWPTTPPTPR